MHRHLWPVLLVLCASACSHDPHPPNSPPDENSPDAGEQTDGGLPNGGTKGGPNLSSSHGSGKLTCESTGTVTNGSTTYTYCVTTIAGAQLKIIEPQDTSSGPLKLALYLHGDGARAYDGDTAPRLQAPWTFTHRTLYVAARAPNHCAWWTKATLTTCLDDAPPEDRDLEGKNAEVFVQIITALRGGWDILDEPILFGGSSGGSVFLTASFLPKYGSQYHGIYALSCGGEPPWSGHLDWDSTNTTLRGPAPQCSAAIGRDVGAHFFPLDEKIIPNSQHCGFDHIGRVTEIWGLATGG